MCVCVCMCTHVKQKGREIKKKHTKERKGIRNEEMENVRGENGTKESKGTTLHSTQCGILLAQKPWTVQRTLSSSVTTRAFQKVTTLLFHFAILTTTA